MCLTPLTPKYVVFSIIYYFKGNSIIIKRKKKKVCYFSLFSSIEKNIIVFIDDDIGQLKSMNPTHIYIVLEKYILCRQINMKDLLVQLDDLPYEILMYIFKKLYNHEVLYSLMGVNQRINRIAYDRIFTRHLRLLEYSPIDDSSLPLSDPILNRFCSIILPEIGHQIETLFLERTSIERVLHATNYFNLNNLGLCDIDDKLAMSFFSGKRLSLIDFIIEF